MLKYGDKCSNYTIYTNNCYKSGILIGDVVFMFMYSTT